MKRGVRTVLVILCGVLGVLVFTSKTFAASSSSQIMEKWFLTEYISQCKGEVETPISESKINSVKNGFVKNSIFKKTKKLQLPSYDYSGVKSKKTINCREMFLGDSKTNGLGLLTLSNLKKYNDLTWSGNGSQVSDFMKSLGYVSDGSGKQTIQIKYEYSSFALNQENVLKSTRQSIQYENGEYKLVNSSFYDIFNFSIDNRNKKIILRLIDLHHCNEENDPWETYGSVEISIGSTPAETIRNIEDKLSGITCSESSQKYHFPASGFVELNGGGGWKYNTSYTAKSAAKSIGGFNDTKDVYWTKAERYNVYIHYLNSAATEITCDLSSPSSTYKKVQLKDNKGKMNKNCYVSFNGVEPSAFPVAIQSTKSLKIIGDSNDKKSSVTLADIIYWLNHTTFSDADIAEIVSMGEISKSGSEDGDSKKAKDTCANSGAAGSLGWIVCPALELMANAAQMLYTDYVEPALQVSPKLFNGDKDSGTRYAWGIFQGVANTIFIVMLLVIIFSQLTGMGIDNYGIKKILPKLIIAAVLINLSYLICVLAVDLSNMIGNGIQQLFNMYKGAEHVSIAVNGTTVDVGNIGVTALTGAVILAALFAGIWSAVSQGGGPALILALVVAALTIVVSILTLFLLLAAREAAIVVLTVASPVAFACYMLPNTKSVFDKWFKFMKALLLLYPICGLLVGGGNFVSKLLLSSGAGENGFFSAFMAMVIGVAPIFFIPSAIRGSMSALGKIGEGFNKFTAGAKSRAMGGVRALDKGVRNTERFKNHAAEFDRKKLLWANGRRNKRLSAKLDRGGSLSKSQERMLARSRAQLLKQYKEDAEIENLAGSGYEASLAGVEAKADADRVSNVEAMLNNGKIEGANVNDARSMGRYLSGALERYRNATNDSDRNNALAEVKAAQNIMSKTDAGRGQVQEVYEAALDSGNAKGLNEAASHLMSNFGDKYKTVNRGFNQMISDLSTAERGEDGSYNNTSVISKRGSREYDTLGTDKYTEETLAGADSLALNRLVNSLGSMSDTEKQNIQATARRALTKMETGNLNVKPEVARQLEQLANGVSRQDQMHDAWRESQGLPIDHGDGSRPGGM